MTYKEELNSLFSEVRNADYNPLVESKLNECHQRTLEIVTELETRIVKLEKDCKITESEVQNWLHHNGKESRENYELREEKKVLYSAIRALTK